VAVPRQRLQATPHRGLFVLDSTEDALENAPTVDPDAFSSPQTYGRRRQEIDRDWQQQDRGRGG
jgi:hypothetical protein